MIRLALIDSVLMAAGDGNLFHLSPKILHNCQNMSIEKIIRGKTWNNQDLSYGSFLLVFLFDIRNH
jgi:hypothetical protein